MGQSEGQKYVYQYLETLAITYIITRDVVSVTKQHLAQVFWRRLVTLIYRTEIKPEMYQYINNNILNFQAFIDYFNLNSFVKC